MAKPILGVLIVAPLIFCEAFVPATRSLFWKKQRFPIADGSKKPVLEPKPGNRSEYLKGIFQGISSVERSGFEVLGELGASPPFPEKVLTAGGGSKNDSWLKMRERLLRESSVCTDKSLKVERAENDEASFGAAILAASTFI